MQLATRSPSNAKFQQPHKRIDTTKYERRRHSRYPLTKFQRLTCTEIFVVREDVARPPQPARRIFGVIAFDGRLFAFIIFARNGVLNIADCS